VARRPPQALAAQAERKGRLSVNTIDDMALPSRGGRTTRDGQATVRDAAPPRQPAAWWLSTSSLAWRLFFTCWILYGIHFATDVVREHYPAVALGDHFTFRLDAYGGLHPDLFETPGRGWHIGNNPGVSLFAAIPYALSRPLVDPLVERVQAGRAARGDTVAPDFDSPRARSPGFFAEAYRRGLDVKLGLAALVTHTFFMAPASALGVLFVFLALRWVLRSDRDAFWLAMAYAFATPVFFRTGFLNHNLMLGHIAFAGFYGVWNPGRSVWPSDRTRTFLAGVAGGTAMLFDYSGVVFLLGIFAYALYRAWQDAGTHTAMRRGAIYVLGTLGPVFTLWFYQWQAFGNPFLPGQHWMPAVEFIDRGYQGYSLPQLELVLSLLFDHRYGLLLTAPILALAAASPFLRSRPETDVPRVEKWACLLLFVALLVFFAGNNYTRLQWNTGIRYLTPILPFLFLPAAIVLWRLPRPAFCSIVIASITLNWCMAMNREVWRPLGVFEPVIRVFTAGFQLPALTTVSRMEMFRNWVPETVSVLPIFAITAAVLWVLWSGAQRSRTVEPSGHRAPDSHV
jgi:hypothetical protein